MLNNLRIPRDHLRKLVAWELTTQATEPGSMFFAAGMHLAHPRPGPLRNSPISLDAAGAESIFLFRASNTALSAGCDSSKISHSFYSLISLLAKDFISIRLQTPMNKTTP